MTTATVFNTYVTTDNGHRNGNRVPGIEAHDAAEAAANAWFKIGGRNWPTVDVGKDGRWRVEGNLWDKQQRISIRVSEAE